MSWRLQTYTVNLTFKRQNSQGNLSGLHQIKNIPLYCNDKAEENRMMIQKASQIDVTAPQQLVIFISMEQRVALDQWDSKRWVATHR